MLKKLLLLLPACLLMAPSVKADVIGPGSCATCFGSSYDLTYVVTLTPGVFDVFLTVDASGYSNNSTDRLQAVALKIVNDDSTISSVTLSPPEPQDFSSTVVSGLSSAGCGSSSGSGFFCSESGGTGLEVGQAGDVYTFRWQLLTGFSNLLRDPNAATVLALYVAQDGSLPTTAEPITPAIIITDFPTDVPEPSSLMLLGTGVVAAVGTLRRRLKV